MKNLTKSFRIARLVTAVLCLAATAGSAASVLTVAVFDFESRDEATRDLGPKAATLIAPRSRRSPGLKRWSARNWKRC